MEETFMLHGILVFTVGIIIAIIWEYRKITKRNRRMQMAWSRREEDIPIRRLYNFATFYEDNRKMFKTATTTTASRAEITQEQRTAHNRRLIGTMMSTSDYYNWAWLYDARKLQEIKRQYEIMMETWEGHAWANTTIEESSSSQTSTD